jgi:hypothetical protein
VQLPSMGSRKRRRQTQNEEIVVTDYDDSDPSSCIAAGARERGLPLRNTAELVEYCFQHRDSTLMKKLIREDRDGVMRGLWHLWNQAHGKYYQNLDQSQWAATQLKALGDSTLAERERGFRRRGK